MASRVLVLLALAACSGPKRDIEQPATKAATPDPVFGCVRAATDDPAACAARGADCKLAPPEWCSGMGAPEPRGWRERQPCQCLCGPQILECQ